MKRQHIKDISYRLGCLLVVFSHRMRHDDDRRFRCGEWRKKSRDRCCSAKRWIVVKVVLVCGIWSTHLAGICTEETEISNGAALTEAGAQSGCLRRELGGIPKGPRGWGVNAHQTSLVNCFAVLLPQFVTAHSQTWSRLIKRHSLRTAPRW